jgi:hypothetical protein
MGSTHPMANSRAHARFDPEPREDFSESSKPFQQPGGGGPVGTDHPRGGNSEAKAETRVGDDVTATSAGGDRVSNRDLPGSSAGGLI